MPGSSLGVPKHFTSFYFIETYHGKSKRSADALLQKSEWTGMHLSCQHILTEVFDILVL